MRFYEWIAGVAQLVEQLICNQLVGGSNPLTGSRKTAVSHQLSAVSKKIERKFNFRAVAES